MKKCLLVVILSFWFCFNSSASSYRSLSLEMLPDVHFAHWWLGYDEKAFDEKWLKKEVACHFDEDNDECHNLAALLRMYVAIEPSKKKIINYANEIKNQLKYDEYKCLEVALLLFVYADDESMLHVLDEQDVTYYLDEKLVREHVDDDLWSVKAVINKLKSTNNTEVYETIKDLIKYPFNSSMDTEIIDVMILISNDRSNVHAGFVDLYLYNMGYLADFDTNARHFDVGSVSVLGRVISLPSYLASKPISKMWKYHADSLDNESINQKSFDSSELVYFFKQLTRSDNREIKLKTEYITKTKAYKTAKPSMKFMIAGHLMDEHVEHGLPILKEAYKQGNNAMKSSIVAQYPELFPVKNKFWQQLVKRSSAAELVLVEKNKDFWMEQMEVDGS